MEVESSRRVCPGFWGWSNLLKNALDQIFAAPWTAVVSGLMIFLTVPSINCIGEGLCDAFDPRKIL